MADLTASEENENLENTDESCSSDALQFFPHRCVTRVWHRIKQGHPVQRLAVMIHYFPTASMPGQIP